MLVKALSVIRKILVVSVCVFFAGCSNKVLIVKPIDVSRAGQIANAQFTVDQAGGYRVALLFVWSKNISEREAQGKLWGGGLYREVGVPIPIGLRVLRNGKLFFEERIMTEGVNSGQAFEYEGDHKSAQVRDIKYLTLAPGEYSFEIVTLNEIEALKGTESYVEFSYYDPKI
ncbi:DUF5625 family protein [Pseudomonas brassicacearum]|uniref:DUF5625 domain-containing protein n=1 Tax=Pseudomonas brassicacearum TaxID=930166 RepID=A0AAJ3FSR5_9PSED|nr:DUF5625 family protein [Pseudomonas brassicacearum]NUT80129.1 hypothetical protein [Pseudomonas brassicacearum]